MSSQNLFDVIVIGGGAAGMMAAAVAAADKKTVLILEKNSYLGKKLAITGGERCNITNAEPDVRSFLENYGFAKEFLFSGFAQFNNTDTFRFFESRNLPLVTQARNRVFPRSEKAQDVVNILRSDLQKRNVTIKTNVQVLRFYTEKNSVISVQTSRGEFTAKSYILATGGVSHPETGSTGDGFKWLRDLGHTIKDPTPSIVPLSIADEWAKSLAGVTIPEMKITFFLEGKKQFFKFGRLLFTHFGLSGPLILNSASEVGELLLNGEVTATVDLYPKLDFGTLDQHILQIFASHQNKAIKNVLKEIVPPGLTKGIQQLLLSNDLEIPVHSFPKESRKQLVQLLKALPLTITGLMGNDRAVSADGGVLLEEVDMRTMRSKKYSNLFIIGDLLHINRPSGGFSLQLCWTTGFIAGKNA